MADHQNENAGKSFWQLMLVIPGTIIGFTLLVSLFAYFIGSNNAEAPAEPAAVAVAEDVAEGENVAEAEATENVEPVAEVEMAAAAAPVAAAATSEEDVVEGEEVVAATEKTGEEVVKAVCAMCHATGMMESPKIGDAAQWEPRIAQGYDTLVSNAINGIRNMPAKGGNPSLSDKEVARAVAYMANQSGANFEAE